MPMDMILLHVDDDDVVVGDDDDDVVDDDVQDVDVDDDVQDKAPLEQPVFPFICRCILPPVL